MNLTINNAYPWGRSFDEYRRRFGGFEGGAPLDQVLDRHPVGVTQPPDVARPLPLHSDLPEQFARIIVEMLRRSLESTLR